MEDLLLPAIFSGIILFLVLLFFIYQRRRKAEIDRFAQFVKLKNVSDSITNPRFNGKIGDRTVNIAQKDRKKGRAVLVDTMIRLSIKRPPNFFLELEPEMRQTFSSLKMLDDMAKKVAMKMNESSKLPDIKIGDKEFDDAFLVRANNPEKIRQILSPELRRQMLELKMTKQGFMPMDGPALFFFLEVKAQEIIFIRRDDILDCNYYGKAIRMLFDLAELIEKPAA